MRSFSSPTECWFQVKPPPQLLFRHSTSSLTQSKKGNKKWENSLKWKCKNKDEAMITMFQIISDCKRKKKRKSEWQFFRWRKRNYLSLKASSVQIKKKFSVKLNDFILIIIIVNYTLGSCCGNFLSHRDTKVLTICFLLLEN